MGEKSAGEKKQGSHHGVRRSPVTLTIVGLVGGLVLGAGYRIAEAHFPQTSIAGDASVPALTRALEDPDEIARAAKVGRILQGVGAPGTDEAGRNRVAEIRQAFEDSNSYDGEVEFALFASWWAQSDPVAVRQWRSYAPQGRGTSVLVAIFDEWGRSDLLAAIRGARSEKNEPLRVTAVSAALIGADAVGLDDSQLRLALEEIPDASERRSALQFLLDRRYLRDPRSADLITWAEQFETSDPKLLDDVFATVAITIASRNPELAAAQVSQRHAKRAVPPPAGTIETIAARWALVDPQAALEWLSGFEAADEQALAVSASFTRYLLKDRPVALAWAAERVAEGAGRWFDPVRSVYGQILAERDPESGLRVLFDLPIATRRARAVESVFVNWKAVDPDAATAWLEASDVSEFRKQQLRERPVPALPGPPAARKPDDASPPADTETVQESS